MTPRSPSSSAPARTCSSATVPPLKMMLDAGAKVALGTDNAMISMPDMFQEIETAARLLRSQGMKDLTPLVGYGFRKPTNTFKSKRHS